MAVNSPNSPRQKMINLMYLVFIAMLALNVSSEVLDGFELVRESLTRSTNSSTERNNLTFKDLEAYHKDSPDKTQKYYDLAVAVKDSSNSLYDFIEAKKWEIVRKADGKKADLENLKRPDDLNAAFEIMVAPGKTGGEELKSGLESYRKFITGILEGDTVQQRIIRDNLNTTPSRKAKENKHSWEYSLFWQMPLTAAITIMTKLQNDIRYAEGEALKTILKNIDVGDFRVNEIKAFVIPKSQSVVRGTPYTARAVLAAVDTTQRPKIFLNNIGKYLPDDADGLFNIPTGATGTFQVKGHIEMIRNGVSYLMPFSEEYFVVEPSATIFPTLMNVLYANYENPIEIAVPGVSGQNVSASMTNGRLERKGNIWVAYPSKAGTDAVVTVSANIGGKTQVMANRPYRVRPLPDPMPFIEYTDENGNPKKFRGRGERISKSILLDTEVLKAAIDDDLLRVNFTVVRFETLFYDSFGNALPVASDGAKFSAAQKEKIRTLAKGKNFWIRGVVARGPGGDERNISPIEVIIGN